MPMGCTVLSSYEDRQKSDAWKEVGQVFKCCGTESEKNENNKFQRNLKKFKCKVKMVQMKK